MVDIIKNNLFTIPILRHFRPINEVDDLREPRGPISDYKGQSSPYSQSFYY